MSLFNRLVVGSLPFVPKFLVGMASRRYIGGETLEEALHVAVDLNSRGFSTTLDMLGENTTDVAHAKRAARDYSRVLNAMGAHGIAGNISVKPTQFGLKVDFELCRQLFGDLIGAAASMGYFVRVEMEDSTCTDATVHLYRTLLDEFDNVGIVIQAYLHRSESDIAKFIGQSPNVRMVKGVYVEPASIAYQEPRQIRDKYLSLSKTLLQAGSYVAFATHDEILIEKVCQLVDKLRLPTTAYEFQMLLGVAERRREALLGSGKRVRVYVPFGTDWYPYSLRRLRENPKIAGYVVAAMLGRA
jgi:proline dehydrogenase